MTYRSTLDFFLYDWLSVEALTARSRYAEHNLGTFQAILDSSERIAAREFAPFNRLVDTEQPKFDGEKVSLPEATYRATRAYAESGLMSATQDSDFGGMQLPSVIELAANTFFSMSSISMMSYPALTLGNANLLMAHGSQQQKETFAQREIAGDWFGTMCLSEPQAGSSLSDIATRAVADGADFESDSLGPRYRLFGTKMWISGGDHELTENIVHLVLAKIPDKDGRMPSGTKGISLFIVPKYLVRPDGSVGERNDVVLAGLNHKLGFHGITNTLLNFGEGKFHPEGGSGAIGYRVGDVGNGLKYMFHMMNEERIGVGMGAMCLGMAGFLASLEYARNRPQGRHLQSDGKNADQGQIKIVEHADVKRMLLAQKSYCEGALALGLYCSRLVDEARTGTEASAAEAHLLLEILTPIAKSWPSEWCLEANSLAIQVLGGCGYTRDFPVEQYWRENRLNMIHEGTHGIQGLDLLGRKVTMQGGKAFAVLLGRMQATIHKARKGDELAKEADGLSSAIDALKDATKAAWSTGQPSEALANATPYLQAFGHVVLAWIWLDVALAANDVGSDRVRPGKLSACRYFYRYELPKISAWLQVVSTREPVCAELRDEWL